MEKKTTIQIFVKTRDRLRKIGERNEDYDSIINRVIEAGVLREKAKTKQEVVSA
jgi:hypothetical protein